MESSIFLDRVRLFARHGVMEQERLTGGDFEVSLRVHYNIVQAMGSDCVDHTLNYATLYELLCHEMEQPSQLLEHAAGRIARAVFERFPAAGGLRLCITKLNPPMGAACSGAGVELSVSREDAVSLKWCLPF